MNFAPNNTNSNLPPILLTSCIYISDHAVKLPDPEPRIKYTLESIAKWLQMFPSIRLVVCDNSGFDFTELTQKHFANAAIECLHFKADTQKVSYHGKGYGEGEIIRYALENSSILTESTCFAKCTAKLWVENYLECLSQWNGRFVCRLTFKNIFSLKRSCIEHIDTRFYLVDKDFYNKYLLCAHTNLGGNTGVSIEDRYLQIIQENNILNVAFKIPPIVGGVGGGIGKHYNISKSKQLKEKLRYWLASRLPQYSQLFVIKTEDSSTLF